MAGGRLSRINAERILAIEPNVGQAFCICESNDFNIDAIFHLWTTQSNDVSPPSTNTSTDVGLRGTKPSTNRDVVDGHVDTQLINADNSSRNSSYSSIPNSATSTRGVHDTSRNAPLAKVDCSSSNIPTEPFPTDVLILHIFHFFIYIFHFFDVFI